MEDFVPFLLAKKLKEKGFREKVNAYYGKHENIFDVHPALDMNDADYRASAPTISQVLKWLRKERGLFVQIMFVDKSYYYEVIDITTDKVKCISGDYKESPELAALAGIEYIIDNNLI